VVIVSETVSSDIRAGYQAYDAVHDHPDTSYYFNDDIIRQKPNWTLVHCCILGKPENRIQEFLQPDQRQKLIIRSGRDFYGGSYKAGTELDFNRESFIRDNKQCSNFNDQDNITWHWVAYTNKLQPISGIERTGMKTTAPMPPTLPSLNFNADPKLLVDSHYPRWTCYVGNAKSVQKITMAILNRIEMETRELKAFFLLPEISICDQQCEPIQL